MTLATRCPACGTVFRVVQDQLRVSEGWVRCGRCSEPFNALEAMVDWPPVRMAAPPAPDAAAAAEPAPEPAPAADLPAAAVAPARDASDAPEGEAAIGPPLEAAVDLPDARPDARPGDAHVEVAASAPVDEPKSAPAVEPEHVPEVERLAASDAPQGLAAEVAHPATPAGPLLIDLPPGIEVVATDGAIGLGATLPADTQRGDDGRIEPVLDNRPPVGAPAGPTETPAVPASPPEVDERPRANARVDDRAEAGPAMTEPAPSFVLQADRAARWRQPGVRIALGLASVMAALGLAAQVTHAYRDRIAAGSPVLRPWLQQACAALGCRVGEYRQIDALSVESSGLVRVEGAPVYRLAVTLRNRAPLEVAAPAIDLALTDAQGQQIARRVLTMADLDLPLRSLKPGSELPIQAPLRIDGQVSGYTVEIFYP